MDSCLLNVHVSCVYIILSCLEVCLIEGSVCPTALQTRFSEIIPFPLPPSFLMSFKCLAMSGRKDPVAESVLRLLWKIFT